MNSATEIVRRDLDYICDGMTEEFSRMAGKRLLITGGAGFLGYYFVQSALHWNHRQDPAEHIRVVVYDNFARGMPDWLTALQPEHTLSIVKHDVTSPLPDDIGAFEFIIHAASIASPIFYRLHPIETMDANVNGLRYLLEYCRERLTTETPVQGFLFFSTSEIYGDPTPENIPTPETYRGRVSCTGPRACYDESKRYGETLSVNFARHYHLPIRIARPFNNYGPGLKITDKRALPDFARDVLEGRDIVLLSDGSPTRTFCYVADAIIGYFKVLVQGRDGESYNIGIDKPEISIAKLADMVVSEAADLFGYQGKVVRRTSSDKDYLVDNPSRRCPNIDKAHSELAYDAKIGIKEGLRRSLIWYAENSEAAEA